MRYLITALSLILILGTTGCKASKTEDKKIAEEPGSQTIALEAGSSEADSKADDNAKTASEAGDDADTLAAAENEAEISAETETETEVSSEAGISDGSNEMITEEQALSAIKNYCHISNPDLKDIEEAGEYPVYWEVESSDDKQIVVLFRSYTGAEVRYYIDRASGDTYVTEFVQGITSEEERTDESFNVKDKHLWVQ